MSEHNFIQQQYQTFKIDKREINLILCHFLKVNTAGLMIYNQPIPYSLQQNITTALVKREKGIPLAYITGKKGFWTLDLRVNQHTLIPRPETELMIELILEWTDESFSGSILDLGTGTGAIALSIAKERPNAKIVAIDFSQECIKIAKSNRRQYQLNNVKIFQSDWFSEITGTFDFILSNPPYVAENDPHLSELSYEPITALTAKNDGFADLETIISQACDYLKPAAQLLLEHGYNQHKNVHKLLQQDGYTNIRTYNDLSDIPRISCAQY